MTSSSEETPSRNSALATAWRTQRRELTLLLATAFLVLGSYAVARPATESLFLAAYSSAALPYAWLAVAGGGAAAMALYFALAARLPLARLFSFWLIASMSVLLLLLLAARWQIPGAAFLLYVWKDVYIVLLVETFWAFANCVFARRAAELLYGAFTIAGAAGGVAGNLVVGPLAKAFGTAPSLLGCLLPLLAALMVVRRLDVPSAPHPERREKPSMQQTLSLLRRSRYVWLLLALVVSAQLVVNLVDFEYNRVLERTFLDTDTRTLVSGRIYAAIEGCSLLLQLLSPAILRGLGAGLTVVAVPGLTALAFAAFVGVPCFATAAALKVSGKALDYSLFRVAKELLYIPLSYTEKTQGKALVDIFGYRGAKAGASGLLLALGALSIPGASTALAAVALTAWVLLALRLAGRARSGDARAANGEARHNAASLRVLES